MNYQKIYDQLVQKYLTHPAQIIPNTYGSVEYHHIIPLCLNGSDTNDNKVAFTPRAHYIAHLLLWKIYPNNRDLCFAIFSMAGNTNATNMRDFKYNSRLFDAAKRAYGKMKRDYYLTHDSSLKGKVIAFNTKTQSICYVDKDNIPTNCIKATYKWISNPFTNEEREICELLPIPDGFVIGRLKNKKASHVGQIQISNDSLNITKYIDKDDPIPDGWHIGCRNKELRKIKMQLAMQRKKKRNKEITKKVFDYFVSINYSLSKLKSAFPEYVVQFKKDRYIIQRFCRYSKDFSWKLVNP